jgi:putative DNA primase/helicase
MECNALPVAKGDDDGLWRRIHVILFERQVPEGLRPDGTPWVDKQLPAKLREEKAGILNWLLEGVGDWLRRGLDPPARVKKALEDYRKLSSPFGDWLNERCVWGRAADGTRTLVGELHADFKDWAEKQGQDKPMSQRAFGDALAQRQIVLAGKNSAGLKYRSPIRLKNPAELEADAAAAEAAGENGRPGAGGGSFELGPRRREPFRRERTVTDKRTIGGLSKARGARSDGCSIVRPGRNVRPLSR